MTLRIKESVLIESIDENRYLVFLNDTGKSYLINSSVNYFIGLCMNERFEVVREKYIENYVNATNNRLMLENHVNSIFFRLKDLGFVEVVDDE